MTETDWPAPGSLDSAGLIRYRDKAFMLFCNCPREQRVEAWQRVLDYKLEIDRRPPANRLPA